MVGAVTAERPTRPPVFWARGWFTSWWRKTGATPVGRCYSSGVRFPPAPYAKRNFSCFWNQSVSCPFAYFFASLIRRSRDW